MLLCSLLISPSFVKCSCYQRTKLLSTTHWDRPSVKTAHAAPLWHPLAFLIPSKRASHVSVFRDLLRVTIVSEVFQNEILAIFFIKEWGNALGSDSTHHLLMEWYGGLLVPYGTFYNLE